MSDTRIPIEIKKWQRKLQIEHYAIASERISPFQVCDASSRRGHEFVGICTNHAEQHACLYHTRNLQTADIIHELLHVKFPLWSESEINQYADKLLAEKYYLEGGDSDEVL